MTTTNSNPNVIKIRKANLILPLEDGGTMQIALAPFNVTVNPQYMGAENFALLNHISEEFLMGQTTEITLEIGEAVLACYGKHIPLQFDLSKVALKRNENRATDNSKLAF